MLVNLSAEDKRNNDAVKIGLLKKSIYVTRDAASSWECHWKMSEILWKHRGLTHERVPTGGENKILCAPK